MTSSAQVNDMYTNLLVAKYLHCNFNGVNIETLQKTKSVQGMTFDFLNLITRLQHSK